MINLNESLDVNSRLSDKINISGIKYDSVVDGEGLRTVCFISGCDKYCEGCHNKDSWNVENGKWYKIEDIGKDLIEYPLGEITISGGDPLSFQYNECLELVKYIKLKSNKHIWLYTGMLFDDIFKSNKKEILNYIDVVVDGKFEIEKKDLDYNFAGSSNQRIINVKETLKQNKIILHGV